jgi:cbb3-type cytochrome c oxidase subunit III
LPRLPPRVTRSSLVACAAAAILAVAASGCGTAGIPSANADTSQGKQLFVSKCGSCHTLAGAGTHGTVGPNLDDAFTPALHQGFDDSTIRAIVANQIKYPGREQLTKQGGFMPANLVTGDNVDNVAAFVASAVANPNAGGAQAGGKIQTASGKEIFQQAGCTGCHTLADAGSNGTVGPNLDRAKPSKALAINRVTNGKGAMPSFKDKLTKQQIDAVATYVSSVTH